MMDQKRNIPDQTSGYSIYHDLVIRANPGQVFEAVSKPQHLANWWPLKCSGKPALGELYNFNFGIEYDWYGQVVQYTPAESFHVKMAKSDPDWSPTTFGFDIAEQEGGTKLSFRHTGWPECNDHFRTSSYCWAMLLNGLKNYLEKGDVVPFPERA